jgi:MraZ protein
MMFLGEFVRTIDDKGKLKLPETYGAKLAAGFVVTRGFDRNLMVFTRQGWRELAEKIVAQSLFNMDSRALRRRLFAHAAELTPDRNGRISLPLSLCEFAGIGGQAVLAGMYDYLEIWSGENWVAVNEDMQAGRDAGATM